MKRGRGENKPGINTQSQACELESESSPDAISAPPDGDSDIGSSAESAAEWVLLDRLKPWDRNPRKNDKAVAKVARSIRRFGFGAPVLARRADGEIIAGHTRVMAAQRLGLERVPVRWMDLDAESAHKLAVADNRTALEASWDNRALGDLLSDWEADADIGALGFGDGEINQILGESGHASAIEEVDCSELDATFILTVQGALGQQADVLERLKATLEELPGVDVALSVGY